MMNNPCEKCICNVDEYCRCDKLTLYETYQQARLDERRRFAEWLLHHSMLCDCLGSESEIIDEIIAEYEKEDKE